MPNHAESGRPDHWLVIGVLSEDNHFVRRPGFTSAPLGPPVLDPLSPLSAELLDDGGRRLLIAGIPVTTPCSDGPGADPPGRLFSGTLPLPKNTALVRFRLLDVLLEEYRVPKGEPRTVFTALPEPGSAGMTRIAWSSEHPEDVPLTHVAGFSADDGATWQVLGLPTSRNEMDIDLDALPGGKRCRVSLKTTDGFHTTTVVSKPFDLPVKPCLAMILAPESGAKIGPTSILHLEGQGYWREERRPELKALFWSSSLAGALGTGPVVEITGLQAGTHKITLVAGEGERAGRASINVIAE